MTPAAKRVWSGLIRFGFRLLYNEFAFTYDLVSQIVSLGQWGCWGRTALRHLKASAGDPVLELAYGTGNLHLELNRRGYKAFGHDLSPYMAAITRRKLASQNMPVRLSRGMAQALPYRSGVFAAVISTFPAEFIIAPETLREVNRVLQPAGQFIIVPNAVLTGKGAVEAGIEALYRITGQRGSSAQPGDIASMFAPYGFDVVVHHEQCKNSVATVIVATRTRNAGD
ncbi:MAG: methyltransferase domain-containing protein [Chloroflexota bacterium]|mgnify:FL=1